MSSSATRWTLAAFIALACAGFLLPLWPLSALAVLFMGLWGRWFVAILVGLLLDLAWGAPLGMAHFLYFPFALLAIISSFARLFAGKYFIDRDLPDRL